MSNEIRSYGPGKFATILDSYVHAYSLDGCDEESGDVSEGGWYGILRGRLWTDGELAHGLPELNSAEIAELKAHPAGAILSEDSQGFVTVELYAEDDAINEAWTEIEAADADYTDEDDSDSDD